MKKIISIILLITILSSMTSCLHEHTWSEWLTAKEATCTENGIMTRVCDDCGEIQNINIYSTGHSYDEWNVVIPNGCSTNGSEERICSICNYKETKVIYAHGQHTYDDWNVIIPSSCLANGSEERICSICNYKETKVINATGHTYDDWNVVIPSSCLTNGSEERICSICNYKETQVIYARGQHTYVNGVCSTCKEENRRIEMTNIGSILFLPDAPLTVRSSVTTVEISSLECSADNSYIHLTVSGEKTYFYYSGTHYIDILFKVYDSEGYMIYSTSLHISDMAVGDKFKDKTVEIPISKLSCGETYTLKIVYGS